MNETGQKKEMNKALFLNLIMMLSSSAMQQLGKLVNPLTNKAEVHLEGAQVTIDMLDMIQEKTSGNLDKDEARMLTDILATLQMNYVEVSREQKEKKKTEPAPEKTPEPEKKETGTPETGSTEHKA